jgi:hypothetical protein
MRFNLALFLTVVAAASIFAADPLPTNCAILPVSQGPQLLRQCSRSTPADVSGYWTPSPSQISAAEKSLPELLAKSGHKFKLSNFRSQYLGVISHGKKIIYVNAFPASLYSDTKETVHWQTEAVIICDGGEHFWGVEFDPDDNTFHNLQFNGFA